MKLLYVWIEKFRNIQQQPVVISPEYRFLVESIKDNPVFIDKKGQRWICQGEKAPKNLKKMYQVELKWERNDTNHSENDSIGKSNVKLSAISSLTALVGENAAGKSSILECLHSEHTPHEDKFFLLIFLDEETGALIVRSCGLLLSGEDSCIQSNPQAKEFIEYRLTPAADQTKITKDDEITRIISICSSHKNLDSGTHKVLGLLTDKINLTELNIKNSFLFMFDYFCQLPELGGSGNKLVLNLGDESEDVSENSFCDSANETSYYKTYFLKRMCHLLFEEIRHFLYPRSPKESSTNAIEKEYEKSADIVSCFNMRNWPHQGSLIFQIIHTPFLLSEAEEILKFFRHATYQWNGRVAFEYFLNNVEELIVSVQEIPEEYFTGLYRLELPFREELRKLIASMQCCALGVDRFVTAEGLGQCLNITFEHLSAGEYQQAFLFSAIYKEFEYSFQKQASRNLIFLFDEPEMHLHPMASQQFVENLDKVFEVFKAKELASSFQIIMATHSPFLVQKISKYPSSISLVEKNLNVITVRDFTNMNELKLPYQEDYSFNLVMHKIFGMATVELHNELYGELQKRADDKVAQCDKYIFAKLSTTEKEIHQKQSSYKRKNQKDPTIYTTLSTYIRNAIDHPNEGKTYTEEELEQSIVLLERLCEELKSETDSLPSEIPPC